MLNPAWRQPARISLLAVTLAGTMLVWAKLATVPKPDKTATEQPNNTLQTSVPISGWQFIDSTELKANEDSRFGRQYRYRQGDGTLNAEQHYMVSDGNVSRYLFVHSPIRTANANLKVKFQPGVGHYGVVSHEGKAYLSACINARGNTTVTEQQFTQNRYAHDLQISRIVPWLLGQESLIDYRCLWTLMSIPLKSGSTSEPITSEQKAYKDLEEAWFSWHQWWQANFPRQ